MDMLENLIYAVQGIWSHKLRSFLTMLGVIIGIASIIAIVSTIKGTNDQIMQNLIGAGNNAVTISLTQGESEYYMDGGAPAGVSTVSDEQKEAIRSLPDAADASFYVKRSYVDGVESGENTLNMGSIYGVDLHYLSTCGYIVSAGRPFVKKDYTDFRKVILIDEKIAKGEKVGRLAGVPMP
jgi:putative ABC transport system permease protein